MLMLLRVSFRQSGFSCIPNVTMFGRGLGFKESYCRSVLLKFVTQTTSTVLSRFREASQNESHIE